MSGLVLSAVVLLAVLLPGLLVQTSFNRATSRWDATYTFDPGTVQAVLLAIPLSLPFHAVWGTLIAITDTLFGTGTLNYAMLLAALDTPSRAPDTVGVQLLWQLSAYVWSQALAAFLVAPSIALVIQQKGWDKYIALTSKAGNWHARLRYPPDDPAGIILSLTVDLGQQTFLYYGLLRDYEVTPEGRLAHVELEGAKRRPVDGGAVYDIPGEVLLVDCTDVRTIDIDYLYIIDEEEIDEAGLDDDTEALVELIDDFGPDGETPAAAPWWSRPAYSRDADREP